MRGLPHGDPYGVLLELPLAFVPVFVSRATHSWVALDSRRRAAPSPMRPSWTAAPKNSVPAGSSIDRSHALLLLLLLRKPLTIHWPT